MILPSHHPCYAIAFFASLIIGAALVFQLLWKPYSIDKLNKIEMASLISVYVIPFFFPINMMTLFCVSGVPFTLSPICIIQVIQLLF
jgi:hypothetical protein